MVLLVGLAGAAVTFAYALLARIRDRGLPARLPRRSTESVLVGSARQTATVVVWVSLAYVAYELVVATTGLDVGVLPTFGLLGVLVGTGVGLIPGCGPQVVRRPCTPRGSSASRRCWPTGCRRTATRCSRCWRWIDAPPPSPAC